LKDLAMASNFVTKSHTPFICRIVIPKWNEISLRQATVRVNSENIASNRVKIG